MVRERCEFPQGIDNPLQEWLKHVTMDQERWDDHIILREIFPWANSNLYYKIVDGDKVILLLYMDDLFLTGEEKLILDSKRKITAKFEMKDLNMMYYFLCIEVWHKLGEIMLSQGKYAVEILKRFRMMDCKSMSTLMTMNLKLLGDTTSKTVDATS